MAAIPNNRVIDALQSGDAKRFAPLRTTKVN